MDALAGKTAAADDGAQPPKLLDQLRSALRVRHYSRRTEKIYCYWVRRFIFFYQVGQGDALAKGTLLRN